MPPAVRVQVGEALGNRAAAAAELEEARRAVADAVRAALRSQQVRAGDLSVTLLDDHEIAAMNLQFLRHRGPTDVISFPLFAAGEDPVGDIYVGYDQVMRQAEAHGILPPEELIRVTVHGVLHVLGHDHPAGTTRLGSAMWQLQEEIVDRVLAS